MHRQGTKLAAVLTLITMLIILVSWHTVGEGGEKTAARPGAGVAPSLPVQLPLLHERLLQCGLAEQGV